MRQECSGDEKQRAVRGKREQVKWRRVQKRQEKRRGGGCVGDMREITNEGRGVRH